MFGHSVAGLTMLWKSSFFICLSPNQQSWRHIQSSLVLLHNPLSQNKDFVVRPEVCDSTTVRKMYFAKAAKDLFMDFASCLWCKILKNCIFHSPTRAAATVRILTVENVKPEFGIDVSSRRGHCVVPVVLNKAEWTMPTDCIPQCLRCRKMEQIFTWIMYAFLFDLSRTW